MGITRMTPQEACEFLGCKYSFLTKQCRQKRIPHFRCGSRLMFTKEALIRWIEEQEQQSLRIGG